MSRRRLVAALIAVFLQPAVPALAQDHDAAPMKATPQKPLTNDDLAADANASLRSQSARQILADFRDAMGAENPRMAVFWNDSFGRQVSDWDSRRRSAIYGDATLKGKVPDGNVELQAEGRVTAQNETRSNHRAPRQKEPAFELQTGFVRQLRTAGVRVVDRDAILRISDNQLENGQFARLSPDQARLEMRALGEHADYLLELAQIRRDRFEIRVLDIKNGSVRAMIYSNGTPPPNDEDRRWIATEGGFEKRERVTELSEVGEELALQTLAGLNN